MAVRGRQNQRLVPEVEGRRITVGARQFRHAPGDLVQPQQWCRRRLRRHRIQPDMRRPLHDQDTDQIVDVVLEVGAGIEASRDEPCVHRIHQLLPRQCPRPTGAQCVQCRLDSRIIREQRRVIGFLVLLARIVEASLPVDGWQPRREKYGGNGCYPGCI